MHFPRGGTGALVQALGKLMLEQGIDVRLGQSVAQIQIADGRATGVTLEDGTLLPADRVICNGDPAYTYKNLIDSTHRKTWTDKRIDRLKYSMGLYVLYFGTDRTYDDVEHHTIIFGDTYQELLQRIFDGGEVGNDLSLYLHRPTATDPALAPDGKDAFYVLAPVPNLQRGDWADVKHQVKERVLDILESEFYPASEIIWRSALTSIQRTSRNNTNLSGGLVFPLRPSSPSPHSFAFTIGQKISTTYILLARVLIRGPACQAYSAQPR